MELFFEDRGQLAVPALWIDEEVENHDEFGWACLTEQEQQKEISALNRNARNAARAATVSLNGNKSAILGVSSIECDRERNMKRARTNLQSAVLKLNTQLAKNNKKYKRRIIALVYLEET